MCPGEGKERERRQSGERMHVGHAAAAWNARGHNSHYLLAVTDQRRRRGVNGVW